MVVKDLAAPAVDVPDRRPDLAVVVAFQVFLEEVGQAAFPLEEAEKVEGLDPVFPLSPVVPLNGRIRGDRRLGRAFHRVRRLAAGKDPPDRRSLEDPQENPPEKHGDDEGRLEE